MLSPRLPGTRSSAPARRVPLPPAKMAYVQYGLTPTQVKVPGTNLVAVRYDVKICVRPTVIVKNPQYKPRNGH